MKYYLLFDLSFLWCCMCICGTFLFCARVLFIQKTEKLDPVHVVKTPKKVSALKTIQREEILNKMLENG